MRVLGLIIVMGLAACQPPSEKSGGAAFGTYLGSETRLLDGDLVNFKVHMRGNLNRSQLVDYAECVAAEYTLVRDYAFARHVRTNVENEGSNWSADAVYTISPTIPRGLRTIEAEVIVEACKERGIPTV